ncbi:hypothetical protein AB9E34_33055, partial [Rhizobium leguminosarum]|uniref:hypothetical protein n=1 Tax=Rhizobium leguminosarum TaxID=384 RepID=UPI003F9BFCB7
CSIAWAIEQKRIRIVRLDLDKLLHNRRRRGTAFRRGKLGSRKGFIPCVYSCVHGGGVFPKKTGDNPIREPL